jgi:HEAT repeat protein
MESERNADRQFGWKLLERIRARTDTGSADDDLEELLMQPYQLFRIEAAQLLRGRRSEKAFTLLRLALNDRSEYVAAEAAESLARIGTSKALECLRMAFAEDVVDRPHYLANAIAQFGQPGFDLLARYTSSESATLRYFAARGLGSTGMPEAIPILERVANQDTGKTRFGGQVATGAKDGLKTLRRMHANEG